MTTKHERQAQSALKLPVDRLELTLSVTRVLKAHQIKTVRQLVAKSDSELSDIGLANEARLQIRDVLASRGL